MAVDVRQFELDRIVTMLKTFEWGLTHSEMVPDGVQGKFQKVMTVKTPEAMRFEVDRIRGVLTSAGWEVVSTTFEADKVSAVFKKIIKVTP